MAKSLTVQLTDEHLSRILNTNPTDALTEFIWNAVDADASNINVEFRKNTFGELLSLIEQVIIEDDGHGIYYDNIDFTFGKLGNSYKLRERKTPKGRLFHGKLGQGRYKGFVLGSKIIWDTSFKEVGKYYTFTITGLSEEKTKFDLSDLLISERTETGTKVIIECADKEKTISLNDSEAVAEKISIRMAPYLFAYSGIKIRIDGYKIDPSKSVEKVSDFAFTIPRDDKNGNLEIKGIVKIIEWQSGNHKKMFLCNSKGVVYDESPVPIKSAHFSYCAYIMTDLIEELCLSNEILSRDLNSNYRALIWKANEIVQDYYRAKLSESAANAVQTLKDENVYPYQGSAKNKIEEAERQVFDICAVRIHQYLPDFTKNSKSSKKFTLELLKQAIVQNPSSIRKILKEIIDLNSEQQNELAELLEKTTLPNIINTMKMVTDRWAFINGFEQILYEKEYMRRLRERSQLHKILLKELWIFGEQYELGGDDISLKSVLKKHIKLLGREDLFKDINFKDLNSLDDIPDLCLWRQYNFGIPGEYENLVIELKRPSCVLSEKEVSQIKRYAYAVQDEMYFDKEKTKWTFILIANKLDKYVKKECQQTDRAFGHIIVQDNLNAYVREWNQVIQETKGRLDFLRQKLEYSIDDNNEGLSYVNKKYKELLPK